ncbi:hypothetical protein GCM10009687_08610 [Asanoa iriomotensis]|uniref:Uncharacterized protein n=1 Tax=Asanoa iriomotensis TaxID=234613 RepID=A0ABQ4C548_9ACTN|nr:hypothetical protein Air01nite_39640 [Asanoa iriomotensis]
MNFDGFRGYVGDVSVAYRTAWVPNDLTPRNDAADLAAAWVLDQARTHALQPFLRPAEGTPGRGHAVLAFQPDYNDVNKAIQAARFGAFAAVESGRTPLIGWAMETRALDLTTGEVTTDTRSAALREAIERIHFFDNNGWTRGFGADGAKRILGDLRPSDRDKDVILGSLCALGSRPAALRRLSGLAERAWK